MKDKLFDIVLVVLFIILALFSTFTFLIISKKETGNVKFIKKYYDIMFVNAQTLNDSSIKVNNEEDYIHIEIPNLNEFNKEILLSIDAVNIGNIDTYVKNFSISNIDTNLKDNDVNISLSLDRNEIIKKSEYKKINIKITYNNSNKIENPYYNFNINYVFDEVSI